MLSCSKKLIVCHFEVEGKPTAAAQFEILATVYCENVPVHACSLATCGTIGNKQDLMHILLMFMEYILTVERTKL